MPPLNEESGRARIGYLLKEFPVVSETFILNEVRAMEQEGVPLALFSLKAPPATLRQGATAEIGSTVARAAWSRPAAWPRHLMAHVRFLLGERAGYRRCWTSAMGTIVRDAIARPDRKNRTLLRKRLRRFSWAVSVARQARRCGVRHLHAHYAGEPLRVAHLVRKLIGLPYSFTAHAKDLYLAPETRLRRRLRDAEFAVGCHHHGVETMRRLLPADERAKVLYVAHGFDRDLFSAGDRQPQPARLLAVGRFTEKKGWPLLLKACAGLVDRYPDLSLDVVGDGRLRPDLEASVRTLGLEDRVRLHGFVDQQELPGFYRRAAMVVLPFRELADGNRDGVPNVLIEAMATGTPIVGTSLPGFRERIEDGVHGLLCEPGSREELTQAIDSLLANPVRAEALGRAASERIAELDYRSTNRPLARRFHAIVGAPVLRALDAADTAGWKERGLARKAKKLLGTRPRRRESAESGIRSAIRPGLDANAWRPDLDRLARRRMWDEVIKARRLPKLLPALTGGRRDARVLDLGCGRGGLAVALQATGLSTTSVDLRFRNCAVTRWRSSRYGFAATSVNALAGSLPFADDTFDAVACMEVLEHVDDPEALLSEIARVLRPDGRCVVTVINRWAHYDPHYHLWWINFMPRSWAERYIGWRRRTKRSYRDRQTLAEMHYFGYREFVRFAARYGFTVRPAYRSGLATWWQRFWKLTLSLGFNSLSVVLEPTATARPADRLEPTRARSTHPSGRPDCGDTDGHELNPA